MAINSKGINVSFPVDERDEIEKRVKELKLPERGGMSAYFQMLRDFDRVFKLTPHYHPSDGKLHFYSPEDLAAGPTEMVKRLTQTNKKDSAAKDAAGHPPGRTTPATRK